MNIDLLHGMRMRLRYYLKLLELKTRIAPRKEKEAVGAPIEDGLARIREYPSFELT